MKNSKKTTPKQKKKHIPEWARAPFDLFIKETSYLVQVVHLSVKGIVLLRSKPDLIEILMEVTKDESQDETNNLENAKKEAQLAQREVDTGFPILHAWAIVALWAYLESLIRNFVALWLKNRPSSWRIEPIERLRIKLGEYESIPKNQKHAFVAELLERELGAGLKYGVTRFETLLKPFGLSGDLPEIIKLTIFEFGQVRNIIAHRASKVDRHLIAACPWLDIQVNTDLHVSSNMFERYYFATLVYATFLLCRIGEKYGLDMSKYLLATEKNLNKIILPTSQATS